MPIRLATAADAAAVRAVYAPVIETTAISFELVVPSEDEMAARIAGRQPAHPWLVAEGDDGRGVVGYAYGGRFSGRAAYDWSVETSVYLAEAARGRGVGRSLYAALLAVLAAQGYRQAMGGIALPNEASVRLHEGAGFSLVGVYRAVGWKFGTWHDVGWWQRPLARSDGPPHPPIPLTELAPTTLAAALRAGADTTA
ncbi:MAG TPA: arsinothricin resistance N-acetyltransferase ArsN1 family B [Acidimicrobiales bacterium]|nr:arsinothricin resistance N-acetyltransferase ArsN1 family B [Acidimicrobiales bacterium]